MNARKLLLHEKVEVRQLEEGLKGSWHPGVIVGVSGSCRRVRYDELLCETGTSKLIESIPVTEEIEGFYQRPYVKSTYRGRIRPRPPVPQPSEKTRLSFGVCVDVLFKEAWWEGVIFDYDEGANERCVFCPDEGDVRRFKLTDLRITHEWDEFSGSWRERGVWVLVNLAKEHKKEGHLFQFIKRVWSRLKVHYGFSKMLSEWTCGAYCVWKEYFREVVRDIAAKPSPRGLACSSTSKLHAVRRKGRKSKRRYLNASVLTRSMHERKGKEPSLAVRTRRMCLTAQENTVISAASQGSILGDGQCNQNQLLATDPCINTLCSKARENGKHVRAPSMLRGPGECDLVKGASHHMRTVSNDCDPSISPRALEENLKISQNNNTRRKPRLVKKKSIPRKLKPSEICSHKLERHAVIDSIKTKQVDDGIPLQVQDHELDSVDNRRDLMLRMQNKGDRTVRFPILKKQRKIRISKHNIRKKRSPLRIKKIFPKKIEKGNAKSKPTSEEEQNVPKPLQEENELSGSNFQDAAPIAASCQDCRPEDTLSSPQKQRVKRGKCRDSVCFVCQYGGELLHCDHCMASYHLNCVDLKEVPVGESFCPSCRCGLCGLSYSASNDRLYTEVCYQCSRQYHVDCLNKAGKSVSGETIFEKFCSRSCFEICARLHELLQISHPTTRKGLTWTITRSRRNDCNVHSERVHPIVQVSQVLNVFHECFEPILEPHTGKDLVADIVYNSGSKFRRLDFHGFYVIVLVDGDELVCVATIRIHGKKVAEMPLVATRFKYRRKGMCRLLVDELEKMLVELGVERLVLPAIAQLSDTWVSSFGFKEMPDSIRKELLGYPFVVFQGTTMFQKYLGGSVQADDPQASSNVEGAASRAQPQENQPRDDLSKRFSLRYKRRPKPEASHKDKTVTDGSDATVSDQSTYKLVYKRRRIQASRDSLDSL